MKGGGGMFSRPRVQPDNYVYNHYDTSTVVPLDFVRPHRYSTFRTIWKRGIPTQRNLKDDYHGNYVDHWISVIVDPEDFEDSDWAFAGTTDETVLDDVKYEIQHYRSILIPSFIENVYDYISEKYLSTYDIRLKIYQLLAIKYHIQYNPIQEARAEILRPAEPASASINGGKRNKMKGVKKKRRTRRKRIK